jgi:serine-type D-Ala-D-Ala carboxypeptidase
VIEPPVRVAVDKLPAAASAQLRDAVRAAIPSVAPAVAIAVWASGAPWYQAGVGWVDPGAGDGPVTSSTRFDLASLTKLFTATAFLRLVSDSKVGLDDRVVNIIPELGAGGQRRVDGGQEPLSRRRLAAPPERSDWTVEPSGVTFRQLLTHTSGMAPWRSVFRDAGPDTLMDAVYRYEFVARPGTEFHYSDLGYMVLGESIGRLAGAPLDTAMQVLVRDRLGLSSVTYTPLRRGIAMIDIAPTSHDDDWRQRRCWGEVEDENAAALGGVAGHAGLFANVEDVARFGVAWLRRDPRLRLGRLWATAVSEQTHELGAARGLGWQLWPADHLAPFGPGAYGHTGFTGTSLAVDPARDVVVALLTNRVHAGRTHEGIEALRLRCHRIVAEAFA